MKIVMAHGLEMVEEAVARMREVARVVVPHDGSREALLAELRDAGVLMIGVTPPAGRELIASAGKLRHIARMGVGVDSVDLEAATEHGVMVTNVPDMTSDTVAEFTMTLLLSLARNIPRCDRAMREGRWDERRKLIHINMEMYGKTHGIVGLGRIGSRVALRCKAFGMRVLYYKRTRDLDFEKTEGVEYAPFETLLRESDSISLHTPLTDETRNLLGRPQFEAMKRTALLVNQSRGRVVKEKELIEALREGLIAGYATDVYETEPPDPRNELFTLENVVLTPHLGGGTRESRRRAALTMAEDVIRIIRGELPRNLVNREVLEGTTLRR